MKGKVVMVTGATGALGEAAAHAFAEAGAQVVLVARNQQRLEAAAERIRRAVPNAKLETLVADLADRGSVRRAVERFKQTHDRLDVLVNNAAVFKKLELKTMFVTNHLGPFLLTTALLDTLKASAPARVLNVSAPTFTKLDFDDLQNEKASAFTAFGASKMCNLLFTVELAERLRGTGVSVNAFHPGLMRSELMNELAAPLRFFFRLISSKPDKPARALVELAARDETGSFYARGKKLKWSDYVTQTEPRGRLWRISEELAGYSNSAR
jgi:NAD(P)-dependent dehydrogenase (short-subunit alcohol dehydrogenase family)